MSVFGIAYEEKADVTVHIGIGTDIVAQHPNYDAAKTAAASHLDFRKLCTICSEIDDGGVVANNLILKGIVKFVNKVSGHCRAANSL